MSTESPASGVAQIGETAGMVWKALSENGPMAVNKLVKSLGQPRDQVMQALGWLAREDKILIQDNRRSRIVSLR